MACRLTAWTRYVLHLSNSMLNTGKHVAYPAVFKVFQKEPTLLTQCEETAAVVLSSSTAYEAR